jgi:hypothetical protein
MLVVQGPGLQDSEFCSSKSQRMQASRETYGNCKNILYDVLIGYYFYIIPKLKAETKIRKKERTGKKIQTQKKKKNPFDLKD